MVQQSKHYKSDNNNEWENVLKIIQRFFEKAKKRYEQKMLKLTQFMKLCKIPSTMEQEILSLEHFVNLSLERHLEKWLEKLKQLAKEEEWDYDCSACYNTNNIKSSNLYENFQDSISVEVNRRNDPDIDCKYQTNL